MPLRAAVATSVALSAFLLFGVELLVARHLLPHFGGAPAVWLTSLFFFQCVLLLGYAWSRALVARRAADQRVHLLVLALGAAAVLGQLWRWGVPLLSPPWGAGEPGTLSVLGHLAVAAGLPFFALAATAPLVQAWEAQRAGEGVWGLYALSNFGALAALGAYPLLIEPRLGLRAQAFAWAALFALDLVLLAAVTLFRAATAAQPESGAPPSRPLLGRWVALSAGGSFALAAVSNFQTLDLAPGPLLWAAPLAVYLLSFVVTFGAPRLYRRDVSVALFVAGLVGVLACMKGDDVGLAARCAAFGALELGVCLLCHGELYQLRPAARELPRYYLMMALGGVLGTACVNLFPLFTHDYFEFPVLLVATAVAAPWGWKRLPLRLASAAALLGLVVVFGWVWQQRRSGQASSSRSFFGVLRVEHDGAAWVLIHGGTVHGRQFTAPDLSPQPTAYYARETGLGQTVAALKARRQGPLKVAVLGLGIGGSIALLEAGDDVTFYEIDPEVVKLAERPGAWFHFLADTKAHWRIELGDARTRLAAAPPEAADLIVLDVFSGDAVPMHLLTAEALSLYLQHLAPDGVLALHVSNRFLQLDRVAFALAARAGLHAVAYQSPDGPLATDATWVLMARTREQLPELQVDAHGRLWREVANPVVWTDDSSSVLSVVR